MCLPSLGENCGNCYRCAPHEPAPMAAESRWVELLDRHGDWTAVNVRQPIDIEWRDLCDCGHDLGVSIENDNPHALHRAHQAAIIAAAVAEEQAKALESAADNMPLNRPKQPYALAAEWLRQRAQLLYRSSGGAS